MRRTRHRMLRLALAGLIACSTLSGGCFLMRDNVSINLIIPLGFGGSPGVFNPFGIVQAVVNSLLGLSLSGTGSGGDSSASTTPPINPGALGAIVTRP